MTDPNNMNIGIEPPCGFFSLQRDDPNGPVCACLSGFSGSPPNCKPECKVSNDCAADQVCYSFKCTNICEKVCSSNAECKIVNHATICDCKEGFVGDPYVDCKPAQVKD
jgi:hypothetical protein